MKLGDIESVRNLLNSSDTEKILILYKIFIYARVKVFRQVFLIKIC